MISLLVLICSLWYDANQVEEVFRFVAKETLEIADESVNVSFPRSLVNDILVVVISQATR